MFLTILDEEKYVLQRTFCLKNLKTQENKKKQDYFDIPPYILEYLRLFCQ